MTRGVQVVMSTRINSVLDALMSALIAVDIDTTWRFLTEYWVVVMDTTVIHEKQQQNKAPTLSPTLSLSLSPVGLTAFFRRVLACNRSL